MSKTMADHARAYRQRKAKKLERLAVLETAINQIIALSDENQADTDDEWSSGYAAGLANAAMQARIARQALNPDAKEQGA